MSAPGQPCPGRPICALILAAGLILSGPARADEDQPVTDAAVGSDAVSPEDAASPSISVELNRVTDQAAGCDLWFMVRPSADLALQSFQTDLVVLDQDGIILDSVLVELGPLRGGRANMKVFPLPDRSCAEIGQLLLNDVVSCDTETGPVEACFDAVSLSSRSGVEILE